MGETRAAEQQVAVSSQPDSAALRLVARRHLERWGLVEPRVLARAAERLAEAVLTNGGGCETGELVGRMRALAERWIADFAGGASDPKARWIWQAGALLGRFPATFLETPLPEAIAIGGVEVGNIAVLPERHPAVIRQQIIAGPLEHVVSALREAAHRTRSAVIAEQPQPQPLADAAE